MTFNVLEPLCFDAASMFKYFIMPRVTLYVMPRPVAFTGGHQVRNELLRVAIEAAREL